MLTALIAQSLPVLLWFKSVNDTVSEPYLDEVFHVRQARHYCEGRFTVWDPKITTPPGLYLLSSALAPVLGCDLIVLRSVGLLSLGALLFVLFWTYTERQRGRQESLLARHSALNFTLFPPLFFFAALYYTDVPSTLSVTAFYWYFLHSYRNETPAWLRDSVLVVLGAASLMFRQTNIFWIAIFPAGIVLLNSFDRGHQVVKDSMYRGTEGFGDGVVSVARTSWKMDVVFDPSVQDAWMEDYIKTLISIAVCACKTLTQPRRLFHILQKLTPYLTLIALFASFILWNGGVVLGDKSNHIATLHLPQMLYIWPYFAFFSWPLIYPYLFTLPLGLFARLQNVASLESMLIFKRRRLLPRFWIAAVFVAIACAVVKFNTIVHPFILADNRHYTFYIFRLVMRPWWVKYAVTPVYVLCGWACIQALGARPFDIATAAPAKSSSSKAKKPPPVNPGGQDRPLLLPDGSYSASTSFVLIWLATTMLQLITAPLVEPRYLILPWVIWRLHLPLVQYRPAVTKKTTATAASWKSRLAGIDHRLWLETAWSLLVNAVTGYIFLNWGFGWPQEPGRVQRFMW